MADSDVWTLREKSRMPFFGELMLPWGTKNSLMAWVMKSESLQLGIAVHFDGKIGIPQDDVRDRLMLVLPHLRRAYLTQQKLSEGKKENQAMLASFDGVNRAVAIVDSKGKVLRANHSAYELISRTDSISLRGADCLYFIEASARNEFAKALSQCFADFSVLTYENVGPIKPIVVRRNEGRPLVLTLCPIKHEVPALAAPIAVLFITDPDGTPLVPGHVLNAAFALSPAEVKLALALVSGMSLREFSQVRSITYETVRVQLKAVLAKTGAKRQSDLVRLVQAISH